MEDLRKKNNELYLKLINFIGDIKKETPKHINGALFYPDTLDDLYEMIYDYSTKVAQMIYDFAILQEKEADERMKQKMDMLLDGSMTLQSIQKKRVE